MQRWGDKKWPKVLKLKDTGLPFTVTWMTFTDNRKWLCCSSKRWLVNVALLAGPASPPVRMCWNPKLPSICANRLIDGTPIFRGLLFCLFCRCFDISNNNLLLTMSDLTADSLPLRWTKICLSLLSPTDFSVVSSGASAAVMFRNSLKMLLTGGKANRKSRSSGESVFWCQPQTMTAVARFRGFILGSRRWNALIKGNLRRLKTP